MTPGTPGGEGILANFFKSLLHKKSGTPGSGNPSLDASMNQMGSPRTPGSGRAPNGEESNEKMALRTTDAAAELDRLSRSVKKEIDFSPQSQSDC